VASRAKAISGAEIQEQEIVLALGIRSVYRRDEEGVWFHWGWRLPAYYS